MTTSTIGAVIFVAALIGMAGWMIGGLWRRLLEERARQAPADRGSPALVIGAAVGLYALAAWLTDYRTAVTLALAAVVVAVAARRVTRA